MHFNMSQEASEEPLYTEIYTKNAAAQIELGTQDTHFARACAVENACQQFHKRHQKSHLYGCLQEKYVARLSPETRTHILREPAQSKCISTCHKRHQKSHFIRKFAGKMPRPSLSPECRHTFCASPRSRNACQDFARAAEYGILQEKCRAQECGHPLCASLQSETHVKI